MNHFDRRSFLKIGSLSVFGYWGLGDVLRLQAQSPAPNGKRDISIIHLWLTGGMSTAQIEESLAKLRSLEQQVVAHVDVPLSYMEEFYNLRVHIRIMEQKLLTRRAKA